MTAWLLGVRAWWGSLRGWRKLVAALVVALPMLFLLVAVIASALKRPHTAGGVGGVVGRNFKKKGVELQADARRMEVEAEELPARQEAARQRTAGEIAAAGERASREHARKRAGGWWRDRGLK